MFDHSGTVPDRYAAASPSTASVAASSAPLHERVDHQRHRLGHPVGLRPRICGVGRACGPRLHPPDPHAPAADERGPHPRSHRQGAGRAPKGRRPFGARRRRGTTRSCLKTPLNDLRRRSGSMPVLLTAVLIQYRAHPVESGDCAAELVPPRGWLKAAGTPRPRSLP